MKKSDNHAGGVTSAPPPCSALGGAIQFPEEFRWTTAPHGYSSTYGDRYGCFRIPAREAHGRNLAVIAVDGMETGWEHVSVSLPDSRNKSASWDEMCVVKKLFWGDSDCVVQFHPPESEYVNNAQVLHLWRCVDQQFPMPPTICV